MLRSGLGATLLFAVRQRGARLVVPQVIRLETIARLTEDGLEAVGSIQDGLSTLGRRPDPDLPSEAMIPEAIEVRFGKLAEFVVQLEPSLDDYLSAVKRVVAKRAPNERKEQFRDSLVLD